MKTAGCFSGILVFALSLAATAAEPSRSNILVIYSDDHG